MTQLYSEEITKSFISTYLIELALTGVLILVSTFYYITKNFNYWKDRNVEHLKPVPIFGNIFAILTVKKSIGQFFEHLHIQSRKLNTGVLGFWILREPCLFVSDPELIKKILVKDFDHFSERVVSHKSKNDPIGNNSVFGMRDPHWKNMRTRLNKTFTSVKLKQMSEMIIKNTDNMIKYIDAQNETTGFKELDPKDFCGRYTADNLVGTSLGLDGQCLMQLPGGPRPAGALKEDQTQSADSSAAGDRVPRFHELGESVFKGEALRSVEASSFFLFPEINNWFGFKFFGDASSNAMRSIFWAAANLRRDHSNGIKEKDRASDYLDTLLQMEEEGTELDGLKYAGDVLVAQFMVLFVAGYETSSTSMALMMSTLSSHPELQERLRKEINEVLDRHNGVISYEALSEMTYLNMAYSEILRLYPTLPFIDRLCTKTYAVEGTKLVIQKGTKVYLSLSGLQTDPRYWKDPETFDPERFSAENIRNIIPFTYMPFGDGPKVCIGERFGHLQSKLGLARILSSYRLTSSNPPPTDRRIELSKYGFVTTPAHSQNMFLKPISA